MKKTKAGMAIIKVVMAITVVLSVIGLLGIFVSRKHG